MRTRQLAVLLVAALAGSALAGDAEERLRAAVAKMADEDPAVPPPLEIPQPDSKEK